MACGPCTHDEDRVELPTANAGLFSGAHWDRDPGDREGARLAATARRVPRDVESVLEVGCGDGRLLRRLLDTRPALRAVGVDRSPFGVARLPVSGVVGDCARLPFPDRSFDCVLCCEVLEHLPDGPLDRAVRELQRVSRRYLLVTVPNDQQLEVNLVRCPACGEIFHNQGHLRTFRPDELTALFDRASPEAVELVRADTVRRYDDRLLRIKQRRFHCWAWTSGLVCPRCGHDDFPQRGRRLVRAGFGAVNAMLHPRKDRGGWILALLRSHRNGTRG